MAAFPAERVFCYVFSGSAFKNRFGLLSEIFSSFQTVKFDCNDGVEQRVSQKPTDYAKMVTSKQS